ncbi:cadherin EGF LAG seven-pass G-type receptor 3, partial [Elysia marginata]
MLRHGQRRHGVATGPVVSWAVLLAACVLASCWRCSQAAVPTFDNINGATVLTVDETAATDTSLVTVAVSDPDTPITLSVNDTTVFDFDANVLKVKGALDYETQTSYSLTITATDNAAESNSVDIIINVVDKNDNDPALTLTTVDVTLDEEQTAGTAVAFVISGSDPDTNDGTTLTFSLTGADSTIFNIDPSDGDITLNTRVDIDPNTANKVYKPVVQVSDGTRSATATLTLTLTDINDNRPTCSPSIVYKTVVEETSAGSTVYTLTCSDNDSSFENNNQLTYFLNSTSFSVNGAGVVTVTSPVDYESSTSEQLLVVVADSATGGPLDTTATVEITISPTNDIDPVWGTFVPAPTANTYTQDENIAVGTSLFTMVATDADVDSGSTITYSIQSVTDGTNPVTGLFNVDSSSGEVTTLAKLDRDAGVSQYTLNLQATDGGSGTHIISQTVYLALNDVNDIAPVFQSTPLALVTIAETNAKTGSVITTVSASDGDVTAASFTYEVEAIVAGGSTTSDWAFDGTTAGQLEFATDLDLDTGDANYHILRLIVKDGGATELTGTTSLTVSISPDNEHTPTISSQPSGTVSIDENESVGTSVASVTGADSDTGDEGSLTYSITAGNTGSAFTIDASSGLISTQTVLDRETLDNYDLEITIADSGVSQKSVTTSVSISVTDANDHQPSCTSLFVVLTPPENTVTTST